MISVLIFQITTLHPLQKLILVSRIHSLDFMWWMNSFLLLFSFSALLVHISSVRVAYDNKKHFNSHFEFSDLPLRFSHCIWRNYTRVSELKTLEILSPRDLIESQGENLFEKISNSRQHSERPIGRFLWFNCEKYKICLLQAPSY